MVTIYKITNTATNKVYIGQTKKPLLRRWQNHVADSKRYSTKICEAIQQFGKDNFKINEIICGDFNKKLTESLEQHYMSVYGSQHIQNGYNIKDAGNNVPMKQETKNKISKSNKGRKMPQHLLAQVRLKDVDRYKGNKLIEVRMRRSFSKVGEKNVRSIKIINIETKETYSCMRDASEKCNINYSTLRAIFRGARKPPQCFLLKKLT